MKRTLLVVLLASLATAACAADTTSEPEASAAESELVASVLANTAEVLPDRLVFPRDVVPAALRDRIGTFRAALDAGKKREDVENVILVADRASSAIDQASGEIKADAKNPYGYIRRALSIRDEGGKSIVMTEQASLDEAFAEFSEGRFIEIGPQASQAGNVGPQFSRTLRKTIPVVNLDGKEIFRNGDTTLRVKRGFVNLNTTVDLGVDISLFKLKHAHVNVDALVDSELTVEASTARTFTASPQREVFAGRWPIGSIGPIPVTLGLTTTIGCDMTVTGRASASAGVTAQMTVKGGVTYDRGDGVRANGQQPALTTGFVQPTFEASADGSVKCWVRPQLALLLFDVGGPTVTPELYAKLTADVPPFRANLVGGFSADIGGKLQIFGKDLGSVDKEIFNVERELWKTGP